MKERSTMWPVMIGVAIIGAVGTMLHVAARVDLDVPPLPKTTATSSITAAPLSSRETAHVAEREMRDEQIRVWNQALAADSASAIALGQLAALHLQRARETGRWNDYLEAETLARRSLQWRTRRNTATAVTLTNALLSQHRFPEAMDVARTLVKWEPDEPAYRALLGEVAMELGDDSTAAAMFRSVWTSRSSLSVAPRLARWLELTNHVQKARRVLTAAREEALSRRDLSTETKAWFHLRVGDLELRAERSRDAAKAYRAGLAIDEQDVRLLTAMARLAEQMGNSQAVIAWGERALAVRMEPAILGLLSNAYARSGDIAKADEYAQTLAVVAAAQPGPVDRAWSLQMLDRQQQVATAAARAVAARAVAARAVAELKVRRDVYGYDLAAWAMYRAGRYAEARMLMAQALRLDTPDPLLREHARAIRAAPTVVSASR